MIDFDIYINYHIGSDDILLVQSFLYLIFIVIRAKETMTNTQIIRAIIHSRSPYVNPIYFRVASWLIPIFIWYSLSRSGMPEIILRKKPSQL